MAEHIADLGAVAGAAAIGAGFGGLRRHMQEVIDIGRTAGLGGLQGGPMPHHEAHRILHEAQARIRRLGVAGRRIARLEQGRDRARLEQPLQHLVEFRTRNVLLHLGHHVGSLVGVPADQQRHVALMMGGIGLADPLLLGVTVDDDLRLPGLALEGVGRQRAQGRERGYAEAGGKFLATLFGGLQHLVRCRGVAAFCSAFADRRLEQPVGQRRGHQRLHRG
jgi:hypothetical protein